MPGTTASDIRTSEEREEHVETQHAAARLLFDGPPQSIREHAKNICSQAEALQRPKNIMTAVLVYFSQSILTNVKARNDTAYLKNPHLNKITRESD